MAGFVVKFWSVDEENCWLTILPRLMNMMVRLPRSTSLSNLSIVALRHRENYLFNQILYPVYPFNFVYYSA